MRNGLNWARADIFFASGTLSVSALQRELIVLPDLAATSQVLFFRSLLQFLNDRVDSIFGDVDFALIE